jgi:hypothetical protein
VPESPTLGSCGGDVETQADPYISYYTIQIDKTIERLESSRWDLVLAKNKNKKGNKKRKAQTFAIV